MIPACRLMSSNTKKLEQAQKRQKKREVDQCQSVFIHKFPRRSSSCQEAAIKFRADSRQKNVFDVANQKQLVN